MEDVKITIAGLGYVGTSMLALLSSKHKVKAVDVVRTKIDLINSGKCHLKDSLLELYINKYNENIHATMSIEAYRDADFVIVAVPTDYDVEKDYFNTSLVESVIDDVRKVNKTAVVVIKSTIPIGYTQTLRERLRDEKILFSPEFLREGQALKDNLYPSRIIVGYPKGNKAMKAKAEEFGNLLNDAAEEKAPLLIMGSTEAEAVKLFANSYLAMRVAFFNELDTFAMTKSLNTKDIIEGVCYDKRIGKGYNNPSFGYGGYCFPKDTKQLEANMRSIPHALIRAIVNSNRYRIGCIAEDIVQVLMKPSTIGVHRLAMKSGSDNFREAAIIKVVEEMRRMADIYKVQLDFIVYEPTLYEGTEYKGMKVVNDLSAFKDASTLIIANRLHDELSDVRNKVYSRDVFTND